MEVPAGKSVQTIAAGQSISEEQLYQMELHLMHAGMSGGRNRAASASRSTTTMNSARKPYSK